MQVSVKLDLHACMVINKAASYEAPHDHAGSKLYNVYQQEQGKLYEFFIYLFIIIIAKLKYMSIYSNKTN